MPSEPSDQSPDREPLRRGGAQRRQRGRAEPGPLLAGAVLLGVLTVCLFVPLTWTTLAAGEGLIPALFDGVWPDRAGRSALVSSFVYAGGITLLATLMAWAPARLIAGSSGRVAALACVPMLLPPYLAYAGWGLMRAPGTWLGDAAFRAASEPEWSWLPVAMGRGFAVIGLACWGWPVIALIMAQAMRWRLGLLDEQLRLDGVRPLIAIWTRIRVVGGSMVAASGLLFVVMLGSAIPLHVAQAKTFALRLWLSLDQSAPNESAAIWVSGWPLWLPGIAVGLLAARWAVRSVGSEQAAPPLRVRTGRGTRIIAIGIWLLSTVVPLGLFAVELTDAGLTDAWQIVRRFVVSADQELKASLVLLPATALIGCLLAAASGFLASAARHRPVARACLGFMVAVSVAGALVPGVLIGSSLAQLGVGLSRLGAGWVADGPWLMLAAVIARWSVLPIGAGVLITAQEPRSLAWLRRLDVGDSVRGFIASWVVPHWGPVAAAGGVFALLGLHEIEAAVQVASPLWPSLPRKLLNMLHFARDDDLSAAVVVLELPTMLAIVGLALFAGGRGNEGREGRPKPG